MKHKKQPKPKSYYNIRVSLTQDDAQMLREVQAAMRQRLNLGTVTQVDVIRRGIRLAHIDEVKPAN